MLKKFLPFFIFMGLAVITLGISVYKFLPRKLLYNIADRIVNNGIDNYVNEHYRVVLPYPSVWPIQEKAYAEGIDIIPGGATKPISVKFEFVNYSSLESWLHNQKESQDRSNYKYNSTTIRYPVIFDPTHQTFFSMIQPGTLITIQNGLSSESHFFSVKIPLEILDGMNHY